MKNRKLLKAIIFCFTCIFLMGSAALPAFAASDEIINLTDLYGNTYSASSEAVEGDGQYVGPAERAFDNQAMPEEITMETIVGLTRWAANTAADTWLEVKFIDEVTITAFQITECKLWGNITSFEIQAYVGEEWKTIYTGTETSTDRCDVEESVETNRVRLYVTGVAGDRHQGVSVLEMDYFGTCSDTFPQNLAVMPLVNYSASTIEGTNASEMLAFDGDLSTRWASQQGDHEGAYLEVDFYIPVRMTGFQINECTTWGNITSYEIQYWDGDAWATAYTGEQTITECILLSSEITTEKVRLLVNSVDPTRYAGVTVYEMNILGFYDAEQLPRNLAASSGATYTASSSGGDGMGAEQAFDQNLTTRWASEPEDGAGAWIEVAFASDVTVEQFNIYENKTWGNVTGYNIQCFVNGEWKTVYEGTETVTEMIPLASPEVTNRVRVTFTSVAEDRYQGVTLWELGIFGIGPEIETPPEEQEPNTGTGDGSQIVWLAAAAALCALSLPLFRAARKESEA